MEYDFDLGIVKEEFESVDLSELTESFERKVNTISYSFEQKELYFH